MDILKTIKFYTLNGCLCMVCELYLNNAVIKPTGNISREGAPY